MHSVDIYSMTWEKVVGEEWQMKNMFHAICTTDMSMTRLASCMTKHP